MKLRAVRLSKTFVEQLVQQIEYGEIRFGQRVADDKKERVLATIENVLARSPGIKRPHPALGLVVYPISETPFTILYDYDEDELRVHFLFQAGANLDDLARATAQW